MKLKKFICILIGSIFIISLVGCSSKIDESSIKKYSDSITENILFSMSDLNYDEFKKDFDTQMDELVPDKASFINLVMPIQNAVGTYEKGSLQFVQAKKGKDIISIIYRAKFTKEKEPVNISISFKDDTSKHKVCNLYFSSPKIKELPKK
ncbi:hypothetical protein ACFO6R_07000 [Eubacterium multiforme]|uniref:DUF3887 domain-containing protein n=1 Tax=Eubacterium multiforme TaxID=83339 RepID=A0ABT9UWH5_9FIRM|nr:hypothetical protein [Eubacterium multiforme]MDQ0150659.1 hypothetical protein [Eubacterium multiforme]